MRMDAMWAIFSNNIDGAIYFGWYGSGPLLRFTIPLMITENHRTICGGPGV